MSLQFTHEASNKVNKFMYIFHHTEMQMEKIIFLVCLFWL